MQLLLRDSVVDKWRIDVVYCRLLSSMAHNTKHALSTPASESSSMTRNAFIYLLILQAQYRRHILRYVDAVLSFSHQQERIACHGALI